MDPTRGQLKPSYSKSSLCQRPGLPDKPPRRYTCVHTVVEGMLAGGAGIETARPFGTESTVVSAASLASFSVCGEAHSRGVTLQPEKVSKGTHNSRVVSFPSTSVVSVVSLGVPHVI